MYPALALAHIREIDDRQIRVTAEVLARLTDEPREFFTKAASYRLTELKDVASAPDTKFRILAANMIKELISKYQQS